MRIVSLPDFDGIVCAALLYEALDVNRRVLWVEPNAMQDGQVEIRKGDIIANLSFKKKCTLWFDHHESNRIDTPFFGLFEITPSALDNKKYKKLLKEHRVLKKHGSITDFLSFERMSTVAQAHAAFMSTKPWNIYRKLLRLC